MSLLGPNLESQAYARGDHVDIVPGSDIATGEVVQVGSMVGMATRHIMAGEQGALAVEGLFLVRKASGTTFAQGAPVQWDNTGKLAVAVGDFAIGLAATEGVNGEDYVAVKINQVAVS